MSEVFKVPAPVGDRGRRMRRPLSPQPSTSSAPDRPLKTSSAPGRPPKTSLALDILPKTSSAPGRPPKTSSALDIPPKTSSAPDRPPKTLSAPNHPPKTSLALDIPPKTSSAPDRRPKTLSVPDRPPKTLSVPDRPRKTLSVPDRPRKTSSALDFPPTTSSALDFPPTKSSALDFSPTTSSALDFSPTTSSALDFSPTTSSALDFSPTTSSALDRPPKTADASVDNARDFPDSVYCHLDKSINLNEIGQLRGLKSGRRRGRWRWRRLQLSAVPEEKLAEQYSVAIDFLKPILQAEIVKHQSQYVLITSALDHFANTVNLIADRMEGTVDPTNFAERLEAFKKKASEFREKRRAKNPDAPEFLYPQPPPPAEPQFSAEETERRLREETEAAVEALLTGDKSKEVFPDYFSDIFKPILPTYD